MTPLPPWVVEIREGAAAELHDEGAPSATQPTLRLLRVERPAVVLGSTQSTDLIDGRSAAASGFDVVRRRSGGGAVLLTPGGQTWVDWWLPAGHPWFIDDVSRAAIAFGRAWQRALDSEDPTVVHAGGLEVGQWGRLVCFAGRGPGEVFDSGSRKLVGVSQRRTRSWLRAQTMVHHEWQPDRLARLFAPAAVDRAALVDDLADAVATVSVSDLRVVEHLTRA